MYLLATAAMAQPITFEKSYDDSSAASGYCVQQTTDGGYIITGFRAFPWIGSQDVILIKTDSMGNVSWVRTYGGPFGDYGYFVQQTTDGGYIITGDTDISGFGTRYVYLIKTNAIGDTLWTKIYGGGSEIGYAVQQTTDKGYIITGSTNTFGTGGDVYLIKTDSMGDSLWTATYGGINGEGGRSVKQTNDKGFIITGGTNSFGAGGHDVYLIKTDSMGDTLWTKAYGGSKSDVGESVAQTTDGGYIIGGHTQSFGVDLVDVYLIKTDSLGDTLWTKIYGEQSDQNGQSVQQTTDGGYIIAATTWSTGAGEIYLIKTDGLGDTLWTKKFGGNESNTAYFAQQTTDGGYVITGLTSSIGIGGQIYLVKTDSAGYFIVGIRGFNNTESPRFSIYPNPFGNTATIVLSDEVANLKDLQLTVYDMMGREVRQILVAPHKKLVLERGGLNNGIYFLHLSTAYRTIGTRKVIIQ